MAAKGKLLAVDWDPRTLRIVYASITKRGVAIDRVLSVKIPPDVNSDDPEQMGAHIRRVLDAEKISARHAVVDIPRDQVALNTLSLPPISIDEMPGVVQIQIAKELPFPVEQASVDFAVEGKSEAHDDMLGGGGERVDVLVAAVQNDVLDRYVKTFEAAGLKLDRVGLRPYASKVAISQLLQHAMPDRVMFLDIRPSLTEVCVLREGALSFSITTQVDIPEFGEPDSLSLVVPREDEGDDMSMMPGMSPVGTVESCVRGLHMEIMRTLEAYRNRDAGGIDHIVICGDMGVEQRLAEVIQERLDISAEVYNPATTFGWEPDEGADAAGFASSLGLVLGHADDDLLHFDFLHPKRVVTRTEKRLKRAPMIAAVVVLFATALVMGGMRLTSQDRATLKALKAECEMMADEEKENKKFRKKFMVPVYDFEEQLVWVDILDDIAKALPSHQELVYESIEMDQDKKTVKVRTLAKNSDTALNAEEALEDYRREGKTLPRFSVRLGTQSENTGDLYPFKQEFRITVLNDENKKKRSKKGKRR